MTDRQEMIVKNLPLVAFVVGRMSAETQAANGIDREDAMSYGTEGLIHAVDNYDPDRGTTFASFAIRRIRGSILDAIRKQDPLPRSARRSARAMDHATQELSTQLGRSPTRREVAVKMGITLTDVHDLLSRTSARIVSLEKALDGENGRAHSLDPVDEDERGNPEGMAERKHALGVLRDALRHLSDRERQILRLRYGEALAFHEIGQIMGLSESRVCQLHKKILASLRRTLAPALERAA